MPGHPSRREKWQAYVLIVFAGVVTGLWQAYVLIVFAGVVTGLCSGCVELTVFPSLHGCVACVGKKAASSPGGFPFELQRWEPDGAQGLASRRSWAACSSGSSKGPYVDMHR